MATDATKIVYGTDCYITVDGTDLGHLLGDVEIEMTPEPYYPDFSRARGRISGSGRIIGAEGKITGTLAEWQYAILSTLYSLGNSSDANSEKIGSGSLGTVTELTNVIVTGFTRNDAKPMRATIAKAIVTSPVATTLAESQESGLSVTFEALYTDAAPKTFPMFIEIGK